MPNVGTGIARKWCRTWGFLIRQKLKKLVAVTVHFIPARQTRTFIGSAVNSRCRISQRREGMLAAKSLSGGPLGQ